MIRRTGELSVDPDGVIKTGNVHDHHVEVYRGHLSRLQQLRSEYGSSWGNDELGQQFGQSFLGSLEILEKLVQGARSSLEYTAESLRSGGVSYRRADESAQERALTLTREGDEFQATSGLPSGRMRAETVEPGTPVAALRQPDVSAARAAEPSGPVSSTPSPPVDATAASTPALSAHDTRDVSPMRINGHELPQGSRLVALTELPDGTVQVDANLYESVTPVAASAVTDPHGRPIDPDGRQFFVVRDNPNVDPAAPGYQPLHIGYPAGVRRPVA